MSLLQSHTAVLERHAPITGPWATEPYETAWASEAVCFVRIEEMDANATLEARVQISPDGIVWSDEGTCVEPMSGKGQAFVRLSHFGGWLRLVGEVRGDGNAAAEATVTIQLVLKA